MDEDGADTASRASTSREGSDSQLSNETVTGPEDSESLKRKFTQVESSETEQDDFQQNPVCIIDQNSLQQSMGRNKEALKTKLLLRRPIHQLVEQGIIPPLQTSPHVYEKKTKLERAKKGDYLRHKIQQRPDKQHLVSQHILLDTAVDPGIQEKQQLLKKSRLADDLNDKLSSRPGPLELVRGNILHVDAALEQAIKAGEVTFKPTSAGQRLQRSTVPPNVFVFKAAANNTKLGRPRPQRTSMSSAASPDSRTNIYTPDDPSCESLASSTLSVFEQCCHASAASSATSGISSPVSSLNHPLSTAHPDSLYWDSGPDGVRTLRPGDWRLLASDSGVSIAGNNDDAPSTSYAAAGRQVCGRTAIRTAQLHATGGFDIIPPLKPVNEHRLIINPATTDHDQPSTSRGVTHSEEAEYVVFQSDNFGNDANWEQGDSGVGCNTPSAPLTVIGPTGNVTTVMRSDNVHYGAIDPGNGGNDMHSTFATATTASDESSVATSFAAASSSILQTEHGGAIEYGVPASQTGGGAPLIGVPGRVKALAHSFSAHTDLSEPRQQQVPVYVVHSEKTGALTNSLSALPCDSSAYESKTTPESKTTHVSTNNSRHKLPEKPEHSHGQTDSRESDSLTTLTQDGGESTILAPKTTGSTSYAILLEQQQLLLQYQRELQQRFPNSQFRIVHSPPTSDGQDSGASIVMQIHSEDSQGQQNIINTHTTHVDTNTTHTDQRSMTEQWTIGSERARGSGTASDAHTKDAFVRPVPCPPLPPPPLPGPGLVPPTQNVTNRSGSGKSSSCEPQSSSTKPGKAVSTTNMKHKRSRNNFTIDLTNRFVIEKIEEMRVNDLKNECKTRNLPVSGSKQALVTRLRPFEKKILSDYHENHFKLLGGSAAESGAPKDGLVRTQSTGNASVATNMDSSM